MASPFRSLIVTRKISFAGDDMRNTQVRSLPVVKVSVESPVPSKVYAGEEGWAGAVVSGASAAVVVTGAVVPAGAGGAGTVVATGTGVGVAAGAGEGPVHPARLTTLMSRIVTTTAHLKDIVPRLLCEAITITIRRKDRKFPTVFIPSPRIFSCMPGKAILVIESPWWTPDQNRKRASVLPVLQGIGNLTDNIAIYHSYFYEKHGFKAALKDDLSHTRENRLYLYVAAHGSRKTVGGAGETPGLLLSTLLKELRRNTPQYKNIEGVILGSCEIGRNVSDLMQGLTGTRITWIFGYTCEIDWMTSTMIDVAILERLTRLSNTQLSSRPTIINAFTKALRRFNGEYLIGEDNGHRIALKDSVTLITKPRGRGYLPHDSTADLRAALGGYWE